MKKTHPFWWGFPLIFGSTPIYTQKCIHSPKTNNMGDLEDETLGHFGFRFQPLGGTLNYTVCAIGSINSHCFPMVGDKLINPIVGVYRAPL